MSIASRLTHLACAGLVGWVALGVFADLHAQTLPTESALPAYYRSSASDKTFPSESSLPTTGQVVLPATLPGESQLPPENDQQPSQNDQEPTTKPAQDDFEKLIAASRDRTPWLRLIEAEHTAPIRVVEFDQTGENLFTAGEDKLVHHWRQILGPDGPQWRHQATLRWQVQRAELGTVLGLVSSGDELFIAGAGADGQQGEIVSINTRTGAWLSPAVDEVKGHHSPVLQMAMLPGNPPRRLVSSDQQHGLAVWQQDPNLGTWTHAWLREPIADARFRFSALDILAPSTVVVPSRTTPWTIDLIDVASRTVSKQLRRDAPLASPQATAHAVQVAAEFYQSQGSRYTAAQLTPVIRDSYGESVTCIATASKSQYVAAADDVGFLYLWNRQGRLALKTVASFQGFKFVSLAFSPDERYLAASATNDRDGRSIVQLWRLSENAVPALEREFQRAESVRGIALSPDGKSLILGNGRRVEVVFTEREQAPQVLPKRETIGLPSQVVFASELPYRWKVSLRQTEAAFDGQSMNWMDAADAAWNSGTEASKRFAMGPWRLESQATQPGGAQQDWIMRGNQRVGRLDLAAHYQAKPGSRIQHVSWLNNQEGHVSGVALSLSSQNDIWVFSLPPAGQQLCSLRRVFRGHEGPVLSIDASPDARYLISSSEDSTIRIWPTVGLMEPGEIRPVPRLVWGFDFAIENDHVVAQNPVFSGPLYIKGLRAGDRLTEISYEEYAAGGRLRRTTIDKPEEIIAFLQVPRFDVAVRFVLERAGAQVPGFQSFAHWRELAAQVIAADREWALWTPSGFYDASFNGNSLFGWQINRGLEREPDFYRADRFQNVLERPDLIRRLLVEGSVQQAALGAGKRQIGFGDVLKNAIALQPEVRILSPAPGQKIQGRAAEIRAEVLLQRGQQLASAKAFASGVAATGMQEVSRDTTDGGRERIELRWEAKLPSDKNLQFQVLCSTREKILAEATLRLARDEALQPAQKPKMYLIAAGISDYQDSRVPSLELGAKNAVTLMENFLPEASALYDVQPLVLTNSSVTRTIWRSTVRQIKEKLRHVQPDDVIVLFVSGHGLVDAASGQYYFVTANARYRDLVQRNFQDCLDVEELLSWSDVPCRKIAILDTCHSGAIQAMDSENLKAAVRFLQSDLVLTLTASEGNQLAAEYRGAQASLFTTAINEALQQKPDSNADGRMDWRELVRQVRARVTSQSLAGTVPQFPTAGPRDLLEVVELPVAANPASVAKKRGASL